jgi:hypothetical protein
LFPIERQRSRIQWKDDMVSDQVAGSDSNAAVPEPREAENSPVQRKYGEFDDAHTPGVDEDVCERDLDGLSA